MIDDDQLDRRLSAQRLKPGWASGATGHATMTRLLEGGTRGGRRGWTPNRLLAVAAVLVLVAGMLGVAQLLTGTSNVAVPRPTNGRTVTLQQGGVTYDVTKLSTVMANTDTVFAGRVLTVEARDEEEGWTTYRVTRLQTVKGSPAAELSIRQHGYVDKEGTSHTIEGQELVLVEGTYLFAANFEPALKVYTVAPGPHAAHQVGADQIDELVQRYRQASRG